MGTGGNSNRVQNQQNQIVMTDIFERIEKHSGGPLGQYAAKAFGYYMFPKLEGELGPHMKFQGKDVLVWSLNNYLGLANDPEVRKVDAEAAARVETAFSAYLDSVKNSFENYLPSEYAEEVIAISKSFGIDAQVVGRVEESEKTELIIKSEFGEFHY